MKASFPPGESLHSARQIHNFLDCLWRARATAPGCAKAFTLIELLLAMAIVATLIGFATPATMSALRGSQLSHGSMVVAEQLNLARQTALATNRSVEVRFYQYADSSASMEQPSDPNTGKFRAVQLFQIQESGSAVALGKLRYLPSAIIIDSGSRLSTILGGSQAKTWNPILDPQVNLPRIGMSYNCRAFRFLSSGATNLSPFTATWFLTLHNLQSGDALAAPPADFFCIRIDAGNGHTQTFRP